VAVPADSLPVNTALCLGLFASGTDAVAIARTGTEIHRLRARLAASGYASAWLDHLPVPSLPPGAQALGVLAIGRPA
jgi:hypothetical protein